jgi:hypothetical protein
MEAKDKINIEIDYDRPVFIFPDLSSEQGNPTEYFKLAANTLRKAGFSREMEELTSFRYTPYESHFNFIARFLDFSSSKTFNEDEEYIYIRIKKNQPDITEQPRVFYQNKPSEIISLIEEGHDFSLTNCYGRNHLHYTDNPESIKLILEANREHQWFDLFDLDFFNSTLLHGNRSFPSFNLILEEMIKESPHMAKTFLYGTNVFENNAFGEFLKNCDQLFNIKNRSWPAIGSIIDFGNIVRSVGKIDPDKKDDLINLISTIEKHNPDFKDPKLKASILSAVLKGTLEENKEPPTKKLKI